MLWCFSVYLKWTNACCGTEGGKSAPYFWVVQDGGVSEGSKSAVILCGQKEMAEAITAIVTGSGVQKEFILTNF